MSFRRFFVVRLAWALGGVWLAATLVFVIFFVLGPEQRAFASPDPRFYPQVRVAQSKQLGPIYEQYGDFLWRLVSDQAVGESYGAGATTESLRAAAATGALVLPGLAFVLLVGVPLGLVFSRRQASDRWRTRRLLYLTVSAMPIWVGLLLVAFVSFRWHLLPDPGYCDFFERPEGCNGLPVREWASHLTIPWITFALPFAAPYGVVAGRVARRAAARAKEPGLSDRAHRRLRRWPLIFVAGMVGDIGFFLGVALLLEALFGIPGLGRQAVVGAHRLDTELLGSAVLLAALLAIGFHFLMDIVVGALEPELRKEWAVAPVRRRT